MLAIRLDKRGPGNYPTGPHQGFAQEERAVAMKDGSGPTADAGESPGQEAGPSFSSLPSLYSSRARSRCICTVGPPTVSCAIVSAAGRISSVRILRRRLVVAMS